jgi:hypothetical protein
MFLKRESAYFDNKNEELKIIFGTCPGRKCLILKRKKIIDLY